MSAYKIKEWPSDSSVDGNQALKSTHILTLIHSNSGLSPKRVKPAMNLPCSPKSSVFTFWKYSPPIANGNGMSPIVGPSPSSCRGRLKVSPRSLYISEIPFVVDGVTTRPVVVSLWGHFMFTDRGGMKAKWIYAFLSAVTQALWRPLCYAVHCPWAASRAARCTKPARVRSGPTFYYTHLH